MQNATYCISKPVEVRFDDVDRLKEIEAWSRRNGMTLQINYSGFERVFYVTHVLPCGLELHRLFSFAFTASQIAANRDGGKTTFATIKHYHSLKRYRVPDETLRWALDRLCEAGAMKRTFEPDGRDKSGKKKILKYSVVSNHLPL